MINKLKDKDCKYLVVRGKDHWEVFNTEALEGAGSYINKYHAYDKIKEILEAEENE